MSPIAREETNYSASSSGASNPRVPGTPELVDNGSNSISINFDDSGNSAVVQFAIYIEENGSNKGYLNSDGTDNGATEVWQVKSGWTETITAIGLTDFATYRFKVKAKNELGIESAFSDWSAIMNTLPDVDYGVESDTLIRNVTGGNTIVDESAYTDDGGTAYALDISGTAVDSGEEIQTNTIEYYGNITLKYKLKNNFSTTSRVEIEYSENYDPETETGDWYSATEITGGESEGITGLTASPEGDEHIFIWDSYSDAGKSELDADVYLRVTPYDNSPAGGDAAATIISAAFGINNRPAKLTWVNGDGFTYDKNSTPQFIAVMSVLRGGTLGFPKLTIYSDEEATIAVQSNDSVKSIAGWEYETTTDTFIAMTAGGIPAEYINGINRVRFTVQTPLDVARYVIKGQMGEYRDRG